MFCEEMLKVIQGQEERGWFDAKAKVEEQSLDSKTLQLQHC
jgi:hypothetical protein